MKKINIIYFTIIVFYFTFFLFSLFWFICCCTREIKNLNFWFSICTFLLSTCITILIFIVGLFYNSKQQTVIDKISENTFFIRRLLVKQQILSSNKRDIPDSSNMKESSEAFENFLNKKNKKLQNS